MDRNSTSSINYGKSLTNPNSQSQPRFSKNTTHKIKSPTYKTPLKTQQVTNFSNANNSMNINIHNTYDKFMQNYTPTSTSKQQNYNRNDKKRRFSFSAYTENDSGVGSNKKRIRNDPYMTPKFVKKNIHYTRIRNLFILSYIIIILRHISF